jgi:hypothetical protein
MKVRPAHAGRLRRPERCVFIGVFAVMAVLVVGITMSVMKPIPAAFARVAASSRTEPAGQPAPSSIAPASSAAEQDTAGHRDRAGGSLGKGSPDVRLTAALRPAEALCPGRMSVAVRDRTTGAEALQAASQPYSAVSSAGPDILAVLLYQDQYRQHTARLSGAEARLAARMIERNSRAATSRLWRLIGGARGFEAGARALRLPHTLAPAGGWRSAMTTASDQLQLLADLTSASSPLSPAARAEEVALMARAAAGHAWAAAAASPGTSYAASGGWHAGLAGSIAIVRHGSQKLIVVVLVQGCAGRSGGLAAAQAAAAAAAAVITSLPPAHASHAPPS